MRKSVLLGWVALLSGSVLAAPPARMVADIRPGPQGSGPAHLTDLSGAVVFTVGSGRYLDTELWRSDGTAQGTDRIIVFDRAFGWGFTAWGGKLFFSQYDWQDYIDPGTLPRLWVTDGTPGGTLRLSDTPTWDALPLKGGVLFLGSDPATGLEPWRSDGTASGTMLLRELEPGPTAGVSSLSTHGDHALLGTFGGSSGPGLWKSDGSVEGTTHLLQLPPGVAGGVVSAGTLAYFFQGDFLRGQWLWRTDETQQGTFAQPLPALPVTHLAPVGESLFVVFLDYAYHFSLWRTSDDGRALVRLHEDVGFWVDGPQSLVAVGSALFLSAYDVAHGQELWRSDGTPEGTGLLRDLAPGPDGSSPLPVAEIDGVLLFVASDGLHGREIWRSDGTSEGTILLRDVAPGPDSSSPTAQTKIDGVLLFAASDGIHGAEVWRSDGTEEGTILVQDVAVGPVSSNPRGFTASGPRVYFSADDGVHGQEPWVGWRGILTGRPERAIADLGEMVEALPLPNGVESSLLAKLGVAAAAVERGDRVAAARALQAFLRRASPGATDEIVDLATQTLDLLGGERRAVR